MTEVAKGDNATAGRAMVVTCSSEAKRAADEALAAGGNAVDASLAAILVLCVIQPASLGVGGYGGTAVIHLAEQGRTVAIDFDSRAPAALNADLFKGDPEKAMHGPLSVGVPGVVAGLELLSRKYGRLPWAGLFANAVRLADEGFALDGNQSKFFVETFPKIDPVSKRALLHDGPVPKLGDTFVQKDLGQTLRQIQADPRSFYTGDIADRIVRQLSSQGGVLTKADLARYQPIETRPLSIDYRGLTLLTPPPPSGGITTLSILKTIEQFPVHELKPYGAPFLELLAEAMKLCWQERVKTLGDPDVVSVPAEAMLSETSALVRAAAIRAGHRTPYVPVPVAGQHTANVVAVDADRNMISLTVTHGDTFGSHVVIDGLGLILGHGVSRFTLDPGSPNGPAPGKRMQHNMSPVVVLKDAKPWGAIGMPGGKMIVTVTAQLVSGLVDLGVSPAEAVGAPRVHTEGEEPLKLSPGTPEPVAAELELMGHPVLRNQKIGGYANVAVLSGDGKRITGACTTGTDGIATVD